MVDHTVKAHMTARAGAGIGARSEVPGGLGQITERHLVLAVAATLKQEDDRRPRPRDVGEQYEAEARRLIAAMNIIGQYANAAARAAAIEQQAVQRPSNDELLQQAKEREAAMQKAPQAEPSPEVQDAAAQGAGVAVSPQQPQPPQAPDAPSETG